ncbi:MAG: hypothetical protein HQK76_00990 [Desulfobacterales bacterium]|nr:hypothetical protein [Desulfobacterales bacterium]
MKRIFIFILFILCLPCWSLSADSKNDNGEKEHVNTPAKDFMADAPWRVKSTITPIPIGFLITDSDFNDLPYLDTLEIYLVKSGGVEEKIFSHDFGGLYIKQSVWEYMTTTFENADNAGLNGKSITAANLGYNQGDIIQFKAWIKGRDDFWQGGAFTFSRVLKVHVGQAFPRFDSNWLYGDTHYHTEKTNNPYEYGGGLGILKLSIEAMDLDFVTTTDHASDVLCYLSGINYDIYYDLNESRWTSLRDWINTNNNESGLPLILGEEVTAQPVSGLAKDQIHMLVYNNSHFISGKIDCLNNAQYSLSSKLNELESSGVAFAAHPQDTMDVLFVGTMKAWTKDNVEIGLNYDTFAGFEVWNTRTTMATSGGDVENIDPFINNGGFQTQYGESEQNKHFYKNLTLSIAQWEAVLVQKLNPIRKVVINAGSDAHGDLNYFTYFEFNSDMLGCNDNAIAKARTLVYAPAKSKDSVLYGLKNGHSIITDGPILLVGIDKNKDGKLEKNNGDSIVGDIVNVASGSTVDILIQWEAYDNVPIKSVKIFLGKEMMHEFNPSSSQGISGNGLKGSKTYTLPAISSNQYLRVECTTQDFTNASGFTDRYRAYTNPIWFSSGIQTQSKALPWLNLLLLQ